MVTPYETVVEMLRKKDSVMNIHKRTGIARMTIYRIKEELDINNEKA